MKIWKRNAVVGAIVVFVCVAVYFNWSYGQGVAANGEGDTDAKLLGEAALVTSTDDDLATGDSAAAAEDGTVDVNSGSLTDSSVGYFAQARLNRQQARDSAIALLEKAAEAEDVSQTVIDEANASIQTMATYTTSEAQVENLVTAKGFTDCICFISDDSVSVVVSAVEGGLTEADTAKIMEIVKQETGMAATQIKIFEATS